MLITKTKWRLFFSDIDRQLLKKCREQFMCRSNQQYGLMIVKKWIELWHETMNKFIQNSSKKLLLYLEKVSCISSCSIICLLSFFSGGKSFLNKLSIANVPFFQHKNVNQTNAEVYKSKIPNNPLSYTSIFSHILYSYSYRVDLRIDFPFIYFVKLYTHIALADPQTISSSIMLHHLIMKILSSNIKKC